MRECNTCRDWRGCDGFEYYDWGDIRFCRNQVLWIIIHRDTLLNGEWVKRPEGWADKVQKTRGHEAPFEKPEQIIAEVEARLERTGRRGKELTISQVQLYQDYEELSPEVKDIINYISGFYRREKTYDQWKADRVYYKKKVRN